MKILADRTIERRVMAVAKQKIANAQKKYDEKCVNLENEAVQAHIDIDKKLEADKAATADQLVNEIIGRFL